MVRKRLSSSKCQEKEVMLCGEPGKTFLSRTEGSISSSPTTVCCMSYNVILELSFCKAPNRLYLQKFQKERN